MASQPPEFDPQQMSEHMKQSAQQIWQAGLGAFAKAQQDGSKVFESLVKEGNKWQETTLQAQAKMAEAAAKASAMASDMGQRASSQFDRLEGIFEERVAKALHQLGLPDPQELAQLQNRVSALEAELQALKDSMDHARPKG
ncbi:MAG: phasin family protein [Limnohabitans sp.]